MHLHIGPRELEQLTVVEFEEAIRAIEQIRKELQKVG